MISVFLALILSILVSQTSAVCTPGQGFTIRGNLCSCYSGYTGTDCEINSADSCNVTTPVDPLATEIVAEFRKSLSSIKFNHFSFTLVSNPRKERYFNLISANNDTACAYPSSSFFTRSFNTSSCQDVFVGNISIPDLVQTCSFTTTQEANRTVLAGSIRVSAVDSLGPFRDQNLVRTTNSVLKIRLNLPTTVSVTSSNITVYSQINLLTAVTSQAYDPETDTATILITSSLQWPYTLSAVALPIKPFTSVPGISVGAVIESDETKCPPTVISDCTQVTTLTITGISATKTCLFNGLYGFSWTYNFRSGAQAAQLPADPTAKANVTLASDNVCEVIEIDAHLTGTIQSYGDDGFAATKLAFIAGNTIYFSTSVTADVNVQKVEVYNLWVIIGSNTVELVQKSVPNSNYASAKYNASYSSSNTESRFSFIATFGSDTSNIFSSANTDAVFSFQVQAELQVTYITSFKKRDFETEKLLVKKQVVLDTFLARRPGVSTTTESAQSVDAQNSAAGLTIGFAAPFVVGMAGAALAN